MGRVPRDQIVILRRREAKMPPQALAPHSRQTANNVGANCVSISMRKEQQNVPELSGHYSYRKLSTGSNCAARAAGRVPKMTPTSDETKMAMMADSPEIGMRYSVRKRTE